VVTPFSLSGPFQKPLSVTEAALLYLREGWEILPILSPAYEYFYFGRKRGRTPFYGSFEHPLRNEQTIRSWFTNHPQAGVGIKTGPGSGIFVLDIDRPDCDLPAFLDIPSLPPTRTVHSSTGRKHLYFQYPREGVIHTVSGWQGIGCVLGIEHAYALAPPTLHSRGHSYMWEDFSVPVAPAPPALLALIQGLEPRYKQFTIGANPRKYVKGVLNTYIRNVIALAGK